MNPAAEVVRCGNHGHGFTSDVDSRLSACCIDLRETCWDVLVHEVCDVQQHVVFLVLDHLIPDGDGRLVPGGEVLELRIVAIHEILAAQVHQPRPLSTQGLGQEKSPGSGQVEGRGMKLHELHIDRVRAGAHGHHDAVADGPFLARGVEEYVSEPSGGEHRILGQDGEDLFFLFQENICACAPVFEQISRLHVHGVVMQRDEIDGSGVGDDLYVFEPFERFDERLLDILSRMVGCIQNTMYRVRPFPGEVIALVFRTLEVGEIDIEVVDEHFLDDSRPLSRQEIHRLQRVEVSSGLEDVLFQQLGAVSVPRIDDASLGEVCVRERGIGPLGEQAYPQACLGRDIGACRAGDARADDEALGFLERF